MTPGRMVAFHGGRPGAGKTILAQNLAAVWARQGLRVLVADLDAQALGNYRVCWDLAEGPTLADSWGILSRFDENTIRGYFPASRSGVTVAALAATEKDAMSVSGQQVMRALGLFRQAYDRVIVDGLEGWDDLVLSILDASDRIIMVCLPDLAGLKPGLRDLQRYRELKFPAAKISLILNRAGVPEALTPEALEQAFSGQRCLAAIPDEPRMTESVSQHVELISLYPAALFTKRMKGLAETMELILEQTLGSNAGGGPGTGQPGDHERGGRRSPDRNAVKERIHALLLENPELKSLAAEPVKAGPAQALLREKVEAVATLLMAQEAPEISRRSEREQLVREVVDEALGLGPLEDLIRDPGITEIMVNRRDQIYIERAGRLELTGKHFLSDKQMMTVIERIVAPLGRRIDESQPYVDARLADGSRVNAIIPPLALKGPALTIRKFSRERLAMADLIRLGSLTRELADFLAACVRARKNLLIAGGTGSGKTTLLNILAGAIAPEERIVTIEDAAELNLPQPHVVTLEARPANIEGKGAVTIRDLVRNSLRMRPDRIVVGECRGGEALDMLQAMNTGHDGSLTTVHANSPKDSLSRLETMVLMSGLELPSRAIREQIAGAIHVVIQQSRLQDGSRRVTQVSEVAGIADGAVVLKDIFVFKQTGLDKEGQVTGALKATGAVPECAKSFALWNIPLNPEWFHKG